MTTTQAAKLIGCDGSSVRRMIRDKVFKKEEVKKIKYPDGTYAYDLTREGVMRVKNAPKAENRGCPRGKKRVK